MSPVLNGWHSPLASGIFGSIDPGSGGVAAPPAIGMGGVALVPAVTAAGAPADGPPAAGLPAAGLPAAEVPATAGLPAAMDGGVTIGVERIPAAPVEAPAPPT